MLLRTVAVAALALFVFSIPSENGVFIPGVGSLSRLIGMGAFALALLASVEGGRVRLRSPSLFVVGAFVLVPWIVATYFWSVVPDTTLSRGITFVQLALLVWMVHQVPRDDRDRRSLLQAYVLGCYFIIGLAVATFLTSAAPTFRDTAGFNPNGFAIVCGLAIPMAWGLALRPGPWLLRTVYGVYPLFAIAAVILAASRGGLLTTLVALLAVPLTLPRLGLLARTAVFVVLGAATWGAFVYLPNAIPTLQQNVERLAGTTDELQGGTLTGRTEIWRAGLAVFQDAPIAGVGAGGFNHATYLIRGRSQSPHNAFLSMAVGTGLVGLLLYVGLFVIILVGILAVRRDRIEHLVLFAALLVGLMPTNSDNDKFAWFIMAYLAATRPIYLQLAAAAPSPVTRPNVPARSASDSMS